MAKAAAKIAPVRPRPSAAAFKAAEAIALAIVARELRRRETQR